MTTKTVGEKIQDLLSESESIKFKLTTQVTDSLDKGKIKIKNLSKQNFDKETYDISIATESIFRRKITKKFNEKFQKNDQYKYLLDLIFCNGSDHFQHKFLKTIRNILISRL